jgi:hypothetical protein
MIRSRPAFRGPALAPAGLLLVLLVGALAVLALARAGQFNSGPVNPGGAVVTPTPTPTTAPVTPRPSSAPTAGTGTSACSSSIHLKVMTVDGAAGSRIFSFEVTNAGTTTCSVYVKRASIVDRGRTPPSTLVSTDVRPVRQLILRPGAKQTGMTRWSNECATVRGPLALTLTLTTNASISGQVPGDASYATPPCNGPGKPALEIRFD